MKSGSQGDVAGEEEGLVADAEVGEEVGAHNERWYFPGLRGGVEEEEEEEEDEEEEVANW